MPGEKESMKVESTASAGQRETTCYEMKERVDRDLEFSFCFQFEHTGMLVSFSQVHIWCEAPFQSLTQNGGHNFFSVFTSSWPVFNWYLYFVMSCSHLKSPDVSMRDISVSTGPTPVQKIWDLRLFPIIFNYHIHTPVTGWPTFSALA